jgi:hypothetical protein
MAMSQRHGIATAINNQDSRQYHYDTTRVPSSCHVDTGRGNRSQARRCETLVVAATSMDCFSRHRLIIYRKLPDSGGREQSEIGRRHDAPARPEVARSPDACVCRGSEWMPGTHMGVEPIIILIAHCVDWKAPYWERFEKGIGSEGGS